MEETTLTARERAVEEFFAASEIGDFERARRVMADDAVLWQNTEGIERRFVDCLPRLTKMYRNVGPWAYSNVRRVVGDDGVCEQHTVTFHPPGRLPVSADICVVMRFDGDGQLSRLEEYLDSASVADLSNRGVKNPTQSARAPAGSPLGG